MACDYEDEGGEMLAKTWERRERMSEPRTDERMTTLRSQKAHWLPVSTTGQLCANELIYSTFPNTKSVSGNTIAILQ